MVGQKSNKKKSKNNPILRGETNKKKTHDSAYCEQVCKDEKCEMYKDYEYRLSIGRVCNGLTCDK